MKTLIAFIVLSWACILSAEAQTQCPTPQIPSTLSVGSHDYTGCIYKRHDTIYLYFSHDAGSGRVEIEKLSPELQKALGFDSAKADEQKSQDRSAALMQAKYLKDLKEIDALKKTEITLEGEYFYYPEKPEIAGAWIRPNHVTLRDDATFATSSNGSSSAVMLKGVRCRFRTSIPRVFVAGIKDASEGEAFEQLIYPTGRTVTRDDVPYRLFAATPELALSLINEGKLNVAQVISACKSTLVRSEDL